MVSVSMVVMLMSCADAGERSAVADRAVGQRIERFENGMLPAVRVKGADPSPSTIWEIMDRYHVPGVSVAVVNNGRLEWAKGYGVVAVGGTEVDTETLFLAGHISQGVAATAALKLVERGLIGLDEDVNNKMTSWSVAENEFTANQKVTLRGILSHTSGLNVPTSLGYLSGEALPGLPQVLEGEPPAQNEPIRVAATPGQQVRYSLGGYVVLQQLLEDMTASPYAEFARTTVLAPLGMERSFHAQPLPEHLATHAAVGHEPTNEEVPGRSRVYPAQAALGMWTTPSDLARLVSELQRSYLGESQSIIARESAEQMFTPQMDDRGLGFIVGGSHEWRSFSLEGHGNNYLCDLFGYVSQGMGAVVMTNSSNGEWVKSQVIRAIAAEYDWPDFRQSEIELAQLSDEAAAELLGRYSFRETERILTREDGRLLFGREGGIAQQLLPVSEDLFVEPVFGHHWGVERDATGSVSGITLILNGARLFTYVRVD
jgi:CubicO group peptidase (beta-lactamase class C family)